MGIRLNFMGGIMLVSIVIPVYNGRKYIQETLESCFLQGIKEKEIIVIDDCSTELADDIIEPYLEEKDFYYIKNKTNQGSIKNCNYGAKIAKGKYLIFLGQDDKLPQNHLKKMIDTFDDDTSFVYCDNDLIDGNGNKIGDGEMPDNLDLYILSMYCISSCGVVISHKKFDSVSGFREIENCPMYGEWILWIDLLTVGNAKKCVNSKSMYRRHETNITNTFNDKKSNPKLYKYHSYSRRLAFKKGNLTFNQKLHFIYNYMKCAYKYYFNK